MTDKDSGATPAEPSGAPTSENSQDTPVQPSTQTPEIDPVKFFDNPDFVEKIRRAFQSNKDKGVEQVKSEVKGLSEEMARIATALKVPPEQVVQAQQQIAREDEDAQMRAFIKSQMQASQPTSKGSEVDVNGSVEALLAAFPGVDADDPGVQAVLASATGQEALNKVAKYAMERSSGKPPASPASIAAPPGGSPPKQGKLSDLSVDDLNTRAFELNKRPSDLSVRKEKQEIFAELERRGEYKTK